MHRRLEGDELPHQRRRVVEIEDPCAAGPPGDHQPDRMLQHDLGETLELHRALGGILAHTLAPVAFNQPLDGIEQIGPDRLRAEIAAPDAAADRVHQEQRERRNDQQAGKIIDFLRPQLDEEEIEAAVRQVDQHRLVRRAQSTVPSHERQQIIDTEAECHQAPFGAAEGSGNALRIDLLLGHIKRSIVVKLQIRSGSRACSSRVLISIRSPL